MKGTLWGMAVVLVLGLTACAGKPAPPSATELLVIPETSSSTESVSAQAASAAPPVASKAPPSPTKGRDYGKAPNITQTVRGIARSAQVAAVVLDRTVNKQLISENADRVFRTGSLVKLLIAVDAL